ncbi:MAG: hypothetical protein IIA67_07620 [Planctomycetes bacterium]|nr:hypothetical protein [Planctomycetota bacterium]
MSRNLIALQNKFLGEGHTVYDELVRIHDGQGFVSDDDIHDYDQLPPDEIGTRSRPWPKRTLRRRADKSSDPTVAPGVSSAFAGWSEGTFVQHAKHGLGQIVWIRPAPGQTRAAIRFPLVGERIFILEIAPVKKLSRSHA